MKDLIEAIGEVIKSTLRLILLGEETEPSNPNQENASD
jgi:hypothetical protein